MPPDDLSRVFLEHVNETAAREAKAFAKKIAASAPQPKKDPKQ